MKGLIIKPRWVDLILSGHKKWEIRGSNTKIRGKIALIKSGSGMIFGTVELVDSQKLNNEQLRKGQLLHFVQENELDAVSYKTPHAWVLKNPQILEKPIPYKHPQGAIIWVNLDDNLFHEREEG